MAQVAYRRVSTIDQKLDRQLADIKIKFDKVFEEKLSGKNTERPQLQEMISYVRAGDVIHVHEISRLARDLLDLRKLVENFKVNGVTVIFHKENLTFTPDSSNPMADFLFNVMGAFAEFERKIIKERQSEGIKKAIEKGVYKNRVQRHYVPQDKIDMCVKLLTTTDWTIKDIAKASEISRGSVYNIIERNGVTRFCTNIDVQYAINNSIDTKD